MEDRAAESVDKWNRKKYTKYLEEEKVAQKGDLLSFRPTLKCWTQQFVMVVW